MLLAPLSVRVVPHRLRLALFLMHGVADYRIVAKTSFGDGASTAVAGIVTGDVTAPAAVTVNSVVMSGEASVALTWTLPPDDGGSELTSLVVRSYVCVFGPVRECLTRDVHPAV